MGGFQLPQKTVREIIVGSIDVIIQAARLRDGSRRITHVTEVIGMEGDVIITQDLVLYNIKGEDAHGRIVGGHVSTGLGRPAFWDRARYYGEEARLASALEAMEKASRCARATPPAAPTVRNARCSGWTRRFSSSSRWRPSAPPRSPMPCCSPRSRTSARRGGGWRPSSAPRPTASRSRPRATGWRKPPSG